MAEAKYKDGTPIIDPYELPIVPCMIHPQYNEDWHYSERMLTELTELSATNPGIKWAIQMIAELQVLWIDATDRLIKIEELARR